MSTISQLSLLFFIIFLATLQDLPKTKASLVLQKRSIDLDAVDKLHKIRSKRVSEINSQDKPTLKSTTDLTNCSLPEKSNSSFCKNNDSTLQNMHGDDKSIMAKIEDNKDMLLRTLYVTLGVTGIVIIYFIVRAVRLRKKRTKSRKYGIITQQGDRGDVEMEPLGDGNEDDEDYTVFEVNGRKK